MNNCLPTKFHTQLDVKLNMKRYVISKYLKLSEVRYTGFS